MKFVKPLFYLAGAIAGVFLLFLLYSTISDYRPPDTISQYSDTRAMPLPNTDSLHLLIWNIGYAGLDASMDFFYDGGSRVRPEREQVIENMSGIVKVLAPYAGYDFLLLQEVDKDSKRSYHLDQTKIIEGHFSNYVAQFGLNYRVRFVPVPLRAPLGSVSSGLLTLSRYPPSNVIRHGFPGNYSWPKYLFMLDRCFLVSRYRLRSGKELLVINTHNSAYDDGSLREKQMTYLKEFLLSEYEDGNYIIVGGDWNQTPHGFVPHLPSYRFDTVNLTYIEQDFPAPDWIWAFDPDRPTNRRVSVPYDRNSSLTTVIDFYLLSPNMNLERIHTVDTEFEMSDHQPVELMVSLIPRENYLMANHENL